MTDDAPPEGFRSLRSPAIEPRSFRPTNVVHPASHLEPADQACADVDLTFLDAMTRAGGIGVVQVVPTFTQ